MRRQEIISDPAGEGVDIVNEKLKQVSDAEVLRLNELKTVMDDRMNSLALSLRNISDISLQQLSEVFASINKILSEPQYAKIRTEIAGLTEKIQQDISQNGLQGFSKWSSLISEIIGKLSGIGGEAQKQGEILNKVTEDLRVVIPVSYKVTEFQQKRYESVNIPVSYDVTLPELPLDTLHAIAGNIKGEYSAILSAYKDYVSQIRVLQEQSQQQRELILLNATPDTGEDQLTDKLKQVNEQEQAKLLVLNGMLQSTKDNYIKSIKSVGDFSLSQLNETFEKLSEVLQNPQYDSIREEITTLIGSIRQDIAITGIEGFDLWSGKITEISNKLSLVGGEAQKQGEILKDVTSDLQIIIPVSYDAEKLDQKFEPVVIPVYYDVEQVPFAPQGRKVSYDITPPNIQEEITFKVDTEGAENNIDTLLSNITNVINICKDGIDIPVNVEDDEKLNRLLNDYFDYSTARIRIEGQYNNDMSILNKALSSASSESRKKEIQASINERKLGYDSDLNNLLKSSIDKQKIEKDYIEFFASMNRKSILSAIENTKKLLSEEEGKTEESKARIKELMDILASANTAVFIGDLEIANELLSQAAEVAGKLDENLGSSIETATKAVSAGISIAKGIIIGDPVSIIQGVMQTADILVDILTKGKEAEKERELASYRELEAQYKINDLYRERLLDIEDINQNSIEGVENIIRRYKDALITAQNDFNELLRFIAASMGRTGQSFDQLYEAYIQGKMGEKEKPLFEELLTLKQTIDDATDSLDEMQTKMQEIFTGTSADALADSIVSALQEGKDSLYDFGQSFENIMKQAMYSILKAKILAPLLEGFMSQASTTFSTITTPFFNMSTGQMQYLSDTEMGQQYVNQLISDLNAQWDSVNEKANNWLAFMEQVTGMELTGDTQTDQLSGAIKGITEETASVLAGQFNAMRIIQGESLRAARENLLQLAKIETHTRDTVQELKIAVTYLRNIDKHSGKSGRALGYITP